MRFGVWGCRVEGLGFRALDEGKLIAVRLLTIFQKGKLKT